MAVDRGDGGATQFRQPLEHLLPAPERVGDRALRVEVLEFADVGAGDEAGRLRRPDDQALRRVQREAFDDAVEFEQDVLRQRIHAFAGAVEAEHDDAVGGGLGTPVPETQTVETSEHAATIRGGTGEGL